jgi:hypothetical protein
MRILTGIVWTCAGLAVLCGWREGLNASTASGKGIRGTKALGRVSGEHRVATAVLTGQARRVVASKSTRRNGRRATAPQGWANDKR